MRLLFALLCASLVAACGETPATGDGASDAATTRAADAASEDAASRAPAPGKERKRPPGKGRAPAPLAPAGPVPETFRVLLRTTKGEIEVECVRAWSPLGVERFHHLVRTGFYSDTPFFAVVPGRYAMFGLPMGNNKLGRAWRSAAIPDEPALESNLRGTLAFGRPAAQANSRSTEVFVNLGDNPDFDGTTAPFGRVVRGIEVADALFADYTGELDMQALRSKGNLYLARFPLIDRVKEAVFVE